MRIAYLTSAHLCSRAAHAFQTTRMCNAFAAEGHEVGLFCATPNGTSAPSPSEIRSFHRLDPGIRVERVGVPRWVPGGRGQIRRLARRTQRFRPDLAYGRSIHACTAAARAGLPTILESHTLPLAGSDDRGRLQALLKLPTLVRIVTTSRALAGALVTQVGVPEGRIRVAHHAADAPRPVAPVELAPARLHVGYVGHLYTGKGMEVVAELASTCPWASFHAIGGTDEDIERWRARLETVPNVCLHGWVAAGGVDRYRAAMDVLVAPFGRRVGIHGGKLEPYEWNAPLKLPEYLAAGRAVVASDFPVSRETIRHGENGLLCRHDDLAAWRGALALLRDDPALRVRLGSHGRADFERNYRWPQRVARVLDDLPHRFEAGAVRP